MYWALDVETSGLDPRRDQILAVGMVPVRGGAVRCREAFYSLVRPPSPAAVPLWGLKAHHIRPVELRDAPPLAEVLREVDRRLRGGALLVHHAAVDVAFLRRAYRALGWPWPAPRVVDTARLLERLARRRALLEPYRAPPPLDLAGARAYLGLPPYPQHHALVDALATAELFLALRARLGEA